MTALFLLFRYSYPTLIGSLLAFITLSPDGPPKVSDSKQEIPENRIAQHETLAQVQSATPR